MWYAIHTKPRQEENAALNLTRENVTVFNPRTRRARIGRGKIVRTAEPLFPGYIFADFLPEKQYNLVRYSRGVSSIVGGVDSIWQVSQEIIDLIRDRQDDEGYIKLVSSLKPGDRVEIHNGPFKGLTGIFSGQLRPAERVMILLQSIGMQARLEIDQDFLHKVR
jgi:transcriptional antiterminator RfaH